MSASTSATDQDANIAQALAAANKELNSEKKKLKVMKAALKEEKSKSEKVEKDLLQANERIESYKQQLADKVSDAMIISI